MKVGLVADHRGYKLKEVLKLYLQEKGYEIIDLGTNNFERVDYPLLAESLCKKITEKEVDYGIALCGTGIGMSIACNKVNGIICGKVSTIKEAKLCKEHNNCNVIAMSGKINKIKAKIMVTKFLKSKPIEEEPYITRNRQLKEIEERNSK